MGLVFGKGGADGRLFSCLCAGWLQSVVELAGMRCESLFLEEPVTPVKREIRENIVFWAAQSLGLEV